MMITVLIKDKASRLKTHFSFVYRSIFTNNNFKDLEKFCNDIVTKYPSLIFDAGDFPSLQETALVSLLKRDDLQVEEAKIWEYTIKWGISQNSNLPADLDEWTMENFLTLKTTLQHCLPYIRYFHISGDDILDKLEVMMITVLIKDKASRLKTHFSFVYRSIFTNNNFKDLEKFCNDIVTKYPSLIFDAGDFPSLQETALVSLLKRDDLQVEEAKIWEYTIKWGISQNSNLPADLDEWTMENFLTLKTTLQHCLPYIRYFHISDLKQHLISSNRTVKSIILPARSILIQEIPVRSKESFSTIISEEHAAEISSWIDCKATTYSSTNYPYKFQLIL
ncbi:hypothetical protein Glove_166g27 [Diversispora epigaea]|uniref:BACK domain-containing protein n=1 Tax=Diversispora epigaea TaxID=1348612 RepID=A0A397IUE9_9GLOM|nr:hypothetical protein Glove_166g27 [Diversispora epigaea]